MKEKKEKPNKEKLQKASKKKDSKKSDKNGKHPPKEVFEAYKIWKSLPPIWRGLSEREITEKLGFEAGIFTELMQIKTQSEFAKKFDTTVETTSAWNKKLEVEGNEYLDEARKWAQSLTKNVIASHYNKILRKFDPISGELWYKVVDGWNEKKELELSGKLSLVDLSRKLADDEKRSDKHNTKD